MLPMHPVRTKYRLYGFTLVELSIVLVIIALLVAGIVIGQQMIRSSEIRATVTQIGKYSASVNTFRGKYAGLPGDVVNPASFGFDSGPTTTVLGNNTIESGPATSVTFEQETSCFWDDLSTAGLIADTLNQTLSCEQQQSPTVLANALPLLKMGNNYLLVASQGGINYFWMSGINSISSGVFDLTHTLTPANASELDSKIDDGVYNQGSVQAYAGTTTAQLFNTADAPAAAADGVCIIAGGYNFTTNSGETKACQLRIKPQF